MVVAIETQLLKIQRIGIFRMFSYKQDIYITPPPHSERVDKKCVRVRG